MIQIEESQETSWNCLNARIAKQQNLFCAKVSYERLDLAQGLLAHGKLMEKVFPWGQSRHYESCIQEVSMYNSWTTKL